MEISVTMRHVSRYGVSRRGKLCNRFALETAMGCKHPSAGAREGRREKYVLKKGSEDTQGLNDLFEPTNDGKRS